MIECAVLRAVLRLAAVDLAALAPEPPFPDAFPDSLFLRLWADDLDRDPLASSGWTWMIFRDRDGGGGREKADSPAAVDCAETWPSAFMDGFRLFLFVAPGAWSLRSCASAVEVDCATSTVPWRAAGGREKSSMYPMWFLPRISVEEAGVGGRPGRGMAKAAGAAGQKGWKMVEWVLGQRQQEQDWCRAR